MMAKTIKLYATSNAAVIDLFGKAFYCQKQTKKADCERSDSNQNRFLYQIVNIYFCCKVWAF